MHISVASQGELSSGEGATHDQGDPITMSMYALDALEVVPLLRQHCSTVPDASYRCGLLMMLMLLLGLLLHC